MTRMQRTLVVAGTLLIASSAVAADWKLKAMWCVSEIASKQGGDVTMNLVEHQSAHARYCDSCGNGSDQYDAVMACYTGNDEKWSAVRKQLAQAGRPAVNQFLAAKAPSCCDPEE